MKTLGNLSAAFALGVVLLMNGTSLAQDQGGVPQVVDQNQPDVAVTQQAYLGVGVSPMHPALVRQLPDIVGKGRGVIIEEVVPGSPAAQAGLEQYDVLIQFNNQDLYSPEQLVKLIRNAEPNSKAILKFVRSGQVHEAEVQLGAQPVRPDVRSQRTLRMPLSGRFTWPRIPLIPANPSYPANQVPQLGQPLTNAVPAPAAGGNYWERFEALNIARNADGTYKIHFEYRDANNDSVHRDYEGTREQIVQAIRDDDEMPAAERENLIRALEQVENPTIMLPRLPMFPFDEWERELFNWPHLDF